MRRTKLKKPKTATATVAIDFFCGAGGMTNGLIRAGLNVLAGIDNELLCEKTYRQNKNRDGRKPKFICKDIFPRTEAYPRGQQDEIRAAIAKALSDFRKRSGIRRPRLVFAICAPCQPFTKITQIEMSEGRQFKRKNDANLLLTTVELIRDFKPDAIICENVEGLVSNDSDGVISIFKRRLANAGYVFQAKIVNASNFGVPQNRRRTIGLAFLKKQYGSELRIAEKDPNLRKLRTVADTIGHLPALAAGEVDTSIPNHRARGLSDLNLKRIACAVPGESNLALRDTPYGDLSLKCHQRLEQRAGAQSFADTYTRMRGDSVAPTITTKCMSITNGRFGHYDRTQNRAITPREAALLQTFPIRYVFHPEDSLDFSATLIGNAVPPKLACFFGKIVVRRIARKRRAQPRSTRQVGSAH
jgi:DNA (cytosine-5)-methyltransferase 1